MADCLTIDVKQADKWFSFSHVENALTVKFLSYGNIKLRMRKYQESLTLLKKSNTCSGM
jgi:hypothetical protein